MNTANPATLEPVGNARIALQSVDVKASISGLYSTVTVTQAYRNLEAVNIEAVYTFPLPLDAVMLELVVEINGQTLRGVVQQKTDAEEQYENAIEEGHSAVLLQQLQPGLYSVNVGNIMAGEQVRVRFRYAQLHHWQGNHLRFHLPTTIAPRYGDPVASGLQPHQVPDYSLDANHGFSLELALHGRLAEANFECPTHMVRVATIDRVRTISLSGGSALMDRDFVLILTDERAGEVEALCAPDGAHHVVFAPFHPRSTENVYEAPRSIKLVVDCSGSMSGTAISQARIALEEILNLLNPMDEFNLFTFGTEFNQLFPQPLPATGEYLSMARRVLERLDANMGGTALAQVLEAACRNDRIDGLPTDILLITDGQVWDEGRILQQVQGSGHRIFTVGVGNSVSESLVRRLAQTTSAACELVSPRENMAEKIVRHFRRMRQPRAETVHIEWPGQPVRQLPEKVQGLYAGDTLHTWAWFTQAPAGKASLVVRYEGGSTLKRAINITGTDGQVTPWQADLPRVAAFARLSGMNKQEAAALAEQYQLVTEHTSCVLVAERDESERAVEIPALRKVPHALPEALLCRSVNEISNFSSDDVEDDDCCDLAICDFDDTGDSGSLGLPDNTKGLNFNSGIDVLVAGLNATYPETHSARLDITTIAALQSLGLDKVLAGVLMLCILGQEEQHIVLAFLMQLAESPHGQGLTRHVRRLIRKAGKNVEISTELTELIQGIFGPQTA